MDHETLSSSNSLVATTKPSRLLGLHVGSVGTIARNALWRELAAGGLHTLSPEQTSAPSNPQYPSSESHVRRLYPLIVSGLALFGGSFLVAPRVACHACRLMDTRKRAQKHQSFEHESTGIFALEI